MNIRQFQIFRQDLTNFNILEIGKKNRDVPLCGSSLFSLFCSFGLICPTNKTEYRFNLPLVRAVCKSDTLRVTCRWGNQVVPIFHRRQHHAAHNIECSLLWFGQPLNSPKGRGCHTVGIGLSVARRNSWAYTRRGKGRAVI